ncbi:MAG TPA: hypothetical protein VK862_10840 [Afifellaceae bacterium]|nr:hypothetical protein [Afifellaceae bacterium]
MSRTGVGAVDGRNAEDHAQGETAMTITATRIAASAAMLAIMAGTVSAASLSRSGATKQVLQQAPSKPLALAYSFECRAQGTPVEFPDDLVVINKGPGSVAAGTTVNWRMENTFIQGSYVLPAMAPNQHVFIINANPGGLPAGAKCFVWKVE